mmetsp:Transcript_4354/g.6661  ORF Transcript_4354/g.6661 Transcript_4354/m.6661 type:complete len:140 (+) Transcript_4354:1-420(+)
MTESDGCWPYDFPPCAHYTNSTLYPKCPKTKYDFPTCQESCPNKKYDTPMEKDRHFVEEESLSALRSIDAIKKEIMTNGPVSASYLVYDDFLTYKSGVYKRTSHNALGGHAVKIIGWGEDYWLVVNSWNKNWGDNGMFV